MKTIFDSAFAATAATSVALSIGLSLVAVTARAQEHHMPPETKIGYYGRIGALRSARAFELFRPASVSKIVTSYAALKNLGSDFRFETRLEYLAIANDATTIGSVRFVGDGDPTFGVKDYGDATPGERFRTFAAALRARGIARVVGAPAFVGVAPDLDRRARLELPRGWLEDDYRYCYGLSALPSSFNFRENCGVYTITDLRTGRWDVPTLDHAVASELKYGTRNSIELKWDPILRANKLVGTYKAGTRPALSVPMTYANTLRVYEREWSAALAESGIEYATRFPDTDGAVFTRGDFVSLVSPPLSAILKPYLKDSLNFVGEALILALGRRAPRDLGDTTYDRGVALVQGALHEARDSVGDASLDALEVVNDGCGLSRESQIAPKTMWNLLTEIGRNPEFLALYVDALPISGVDGTLKNRLDEPKLIGRVHAKTGSLDGVSNLAGFFKSSVGVSVAWTPFVIFDQSASVVAPRPEVDRLFRKWLGLATESEPNALMPSRIDEWVRDRSEPLRIDGARF